MNKFLKISLALALAALALSCTREIDAPVSNPRPDRPEAEHGLVDASFALYKNAAKGINANWDDADRCAVFDGVQVGAASFALQSKDGLNAIFAGQVADEANLYYFVFPESQCKGFEEGVATIEIPENQNIGLEGATRSLPAVGLTGVQECWLSNMAATVSVTIDCDDIVSLSLTPRSGEKLSGTESVKIYEGEATTLEEKGSTITLKPDGEAFPAGEVAFVVLPTSVSEGFSVIAQRKDGLVSNTIFKGSYTLEIGSNIALGSIDKPMPEKEAFTASLAEATSSSLSFTWTTGDVTKDVATAWTFGIYRDSACEDLIVRFSTPASLSQWAGKSPKFIFAGLDPATTYYFKARSDAFTSESTEVEVSNVVEAKTKEYTVVEVPSSAAVGDVILSEDFGELGYFGDALGNAVGYINAPNYKAGKTLESNPGPAILSGNDPSSITYQGFYDEARLYREMAAVTAQTRLNSWGQINEGSAALICMKPGYLKLGAESFATQLVTPALDCIPEGKYATLKVTLKASRYDSDPLNAMINIVEGENNGDHNVQVTSSRTAARYNLNATKGWNEYEIEVPDVRKGERLAFGMDRVAAGTVKGKAQLRFFLDEVKVELVKISDYAKLTSPEVKCDKSAYTDAKISWNTVVSATGFKIYVNGSQVADVAADVTSYTLTGLSQNATSTVKVEAYNSDDSLSSECEVKTKNVWRVTGQSDGPRQATFQWDPVDNGDINGFGRCYLMEVYDDAACQNVVYSCYPFNGINSNDAAFSNSSWLGRYPNGNSFSNNCYDTKITFAGLKPSTNYWFRVKAVGNVTIVRTTGNKTTKTLTNPYGDSQWSEPLEFTTSARRTPAANEIVSCGFDDFCTQADFANNCAGVTPDAKDRVKYASLVNNGAAYYTASDMCTYELGTGMHEAGTWGYTSGDTKFLTYAKVPGTMSNNMVLNQYCQDGKGWNICHQSRPVMGALLLDEATATAGSYIATPQLNSSLLSSTPTRCTITFRYMGISNNVDYTGKFDIWKSNSAGSFSQLKVESFPKPFTQGDAAVANNFTPDRTWRTFSFDVDLVNGDVLIIRNCSTPGWQRGRILIDDIKVVVKQ